jgi:hypothetical protein
LVIAAPLPTVLKRIEPVYIGELNGKATWAWQSMILIASSQSK